MVNRVENGSRWGKRRKGTSLNFKTLDFKAGGDFFHGFFTHFGLGLIRREVFAVRRKGIQRIAIQIEHKQDQKDEGDQNTFSFHGYLWLRCGKCGYVKKTGKILTRYTAFVFSLLGFRLIVVVWHGDIA